MLLLFSNVPIKISSERLHQEAAVTPNEDVKLWYRLRDCTLFPHANIVEEYASEVCICVP
jgi:hypothetical protein